MRRGFLCAVLFTALLSGGCGAAPPVAGPAQGGAAGPEEDTSARSAGPAEDAQGGSVGPAGDTQGGSASPAEDTQRGSASLGEDAQAGSYGDRAARPEPVTLEVYSQLSGYQGEQQGWFARVLAEKFNVKLNFIYDGTDDFYERRAAEGDLGDLIIWGTDSDQYQSAIENGLLLDWEADGLLETHGGYIRTHMEKALEKNRRISGGRIYGIGNDVAAESGEYGDFDYHPDIRWDLYEQIGMPRVTELEDYAEVLRQMKEICPLSDSGRETYGVSLFQDWDGDMMMFAKSTCTNFFGMDEFGVGLYNVSDGSFQGCLEKGGCYERVLRFYNTLYRDGLLDPESRTQGYGGCVEDYQDGAAFFCIFGWLAAPQYNTVNHTADGKMMLPLAAGNQNTLVYGLNENGGNRLWTIGAGTAHPELAMEVLNWLCTPEGRLTQEYGPKGVGWDYDLEKNTCLISPPAGEMSEGIPEFNNTTWTIYTVNPDSNGQTYNDASWPNVMGADVCAVEQRWREVNQASSAREYLSGFRYAVSKPNTYAAGAKPSELAQVWEKVTEIIRTGSWDAVYAETEAQFQQILEEMYRQAEEAGYPACVQWCEQEAARRRASEE